MTARYRQIGAKDNQRLFAYTPDYRTTAFLQRLAAKMSRADVRVNVQASEVVPMRYDGVCSPVYVDGVYVQYAVFMETCAP